MENHCSFNGKTHYKWPFSIAMLVITRGYFHLLAKSQSFAEMPSATRTLVISSCYRPSTRKNIPSIAFKTRQVYFGENSKQKQSHHSSFCNLYTSWQHVYFWHEWELRIIVLFWYIPPTHVWSGQMTTELVFVVFIVIANLRHSAKTC